MRTVLPRVDGIHLGPLHPRDIDAAILDLLEPERRLVILDVQGYVRSVKKQQVVPLVSDLLSSGLRAAHVVKSDSHELHAILAHYESSLYDVINTFRVREWVVTRGDRGGFIQEAAGVLHPYDAGQAAGPADPTGSGDVFLAAYTAARFIGRKPIEAAARHAARKAASHAAGRYIRPARLNWIDKGPSAV
jgi:sugar/nucleoside kinase (ribokinase family)